MINQQNRSNYSKALQKVQTLVKRTLLKDAPQPFYKQKQVQVQVKQNIPIQAEKEPINYPTSYNQNSKPSSKAPISSKNYQYQQSFSTNQFNNNEERGEWHISMMHKQKSLSRNKKLPPKKQSLKKNANKFQSALSTLNSFKKTDVKEWQTNSKIKDADLYKALKAKFNINEFRNNQKAIIKCTMLGNDVFVCMPTGGGKSLTFQLPLTLEAGVTFCILPLKALIYDQQLQAQSMKLKAYGLTGNTQHEAASLIYRAMKDCQNSKQGILIFSTPEKLNKSQKLLDILTTINQKGMFKRIVIDEVHCVSTWGRDFRKQYQNLGFLKKIFPNVPILALTATASSQIKEDIVNQLGIKGCYYFQSSFNRPNLMYSVLPKQPSKVIDDIIKIINKYHQKCGLIYCTTKKQTQQVSNKLKKKGINAHHFHAEMQDSLKKSVQQKWLSDQIHIVVATIAFGMGINKPDVRYVIHYTFSKSLENYYQQSGRAGRDGKSSECILFFRYSDKNNQIFLISNNDQSSEQNKNYLIGKVNQMINYCQDKSTCRRKIQLNYFGEDFDPENCHQTCDNCKNNQGGEQQNKDNCYPQAHAIVSFVLELAQKRQSFTKGQLADFLKGKNKNLEQKLKFFQRKNISMQITEVFTDQQWKVTTLKKFIQQLAGKEFLKEEVKTFNGRSVMYLSTSDVRLQRLQEQGCFYFEFDNNNVKKKMKYKQQVSTNKQESNPDGSESDFKSVDFEEYAYQNKTAGQIEEEEELDSAVLDYIKVLQKQKKQKENTNDQNLYNDALSFLDQESDDEGI